jgi:hypothetical protein
MSRLSGAGLRFLVVTLSANRIGSGPRGVQSGALHFVLGTLHLMLKLLASLLELTHALAQAAGEGGERLRAEKHEDEDGDDEEEKPKKKAAPKRDTCSRKNAHSFAQGDDEEEGDADGDDFNEPEDEVSERGS